MEHLGYPADTGRPEMPIPPVKLRQFPLDDFDPEIDGDGFETADDGMLNGDDFSPLFSPHIEHQSTNWEADPLLSDDMSEGEIIEYWSKRPYTVEDAIEHIGFGKFQIKIFLINGLFTVTDAMEMLLLAVLSPAIRCDWLLSEWQIAMITTVVFIGMFFGSYGWGVVADKYGRRNTCIISSIWISFFGFLTSLSPSYYWLLILRGAVGFGIGGAIQSFTLSTEYMPSKSRAKVLTLGGIWWSIGGFLEIFFAYLILPSLGWRWLVAFSALPTFLSCIGLCFLPESARFLVAAGRKQEALVTLQRIARTNNTSVPPGQLVSEKSVARGQLKDLFSSEYMRTTFILAFQWFAMAFCYYGVVLLSSDILENGDYCGADPRIELDVGEICHCNPHTAKDYITMLETTFGEFFAIPFNFFLVDMIGRRKCLSLFWFIAAISFLCIQACTSRIGLTIFIFGVRAFTPGNMAYIYTGEVYPTTVRALSVGFGSAMARIGAMVTPFTGQVLVQTSKVASVWIYGIICFACGVLGFALPIETLGRELKESKKSPMTNPPSDDEGL